MAKKRLGDLVSEGVTQPPEMPATPENLGRTVSVGVGLKQGEVAAIDELARSIGFTRNAVMGWLLRYCLAELRAGRLEIPVVTETKRKLGKP